MTAILKLEGLKKRFGALQVTDGVSLEIAPGELHAIIGPNGAGKTTLVGEITGEIVLDEGRVLFDGSDVTRLPVHARAQKGLARSFQITQVLPGFSVLANVAIAAQAKAGSSFRIFGRVDREERLNERARAALTEVGLLDAADRPASVLSHGEKRQLELAMSLAADPKLLVLDEPMAGMSREETERMVDSLEKLHGRCAMLLIEHDMEAVFRLADRVSVLVAGRVIACDTPTAVRSDPAVREAYLGEEEAA